MITSFDLVKKGGNYDEEFNRTYYREYQAISDSENDEEPEVYTHPLCPVVRTRTRFDNHATWTTVNAVLRPKSRYIWDVRCEASTKRTAVPPTENPLAQAADVRSTSKIVYEDGYIDFDGKPCVNAAGDLVVVKVPKLRIQFKVTKNVGLVNGWLSNLEAVVNSNTVRMKGVLYPRGTLCVTECTLGTDDIKNDVPFMVAELTIDHKAEGWEVQYLNVGLHELADHPDGIINPKTNKVLKVKARCVDEQGEPEPNVVFLDKFGVRPRVSLAVNGVDTSFLKKPLEVKDIVVINRRFVNYIDFNKLPIR